MNEKIDYDRLAKFTKTLGNPLRLKIMYLLENKAHYVYEIAEELKVEAHIISEQLRILRLLDIVGFKKIKRKALYELKHPEIQKLLSELHTIITRSDTKPNI